MYVWYDGSLSHLSLTSHCQVLHFFNAPPSFTEDDMMSVLKETGTPSPDRIRLFPVKPGARSAAGLIEYPGLSEACETIVTANHTTIPNPCK